MCPVPVPAFPPSPRRGRGAACDELRRVGGEGLRVPPACPVPMFPALGQLLCWVNSLVKRKCPDPPANFFPSRLAGLDPRSHLGEGPVSPRFFSVKQRVPSRRPRPVSGLSDSGRPGADRVPSRDTPPGTACRPIQSRPVPIQSRPVSCPVPMLERVPSRRPRPVNGYEMFPDLPSRGLSSRGRLPGIFFSPM
jgi:hypothetical protein